MRTLETMPRGGGRYRWTAVLLSLALTGGATGAAAAPREPAAGDVDRERARRAIAAHTLRTLDGRSFSLGALRGQVVVVNFWASWCPPCREELPRLDALHRSLAGRGGRVVAISIDREARNVERFTRAHRLTLPVCHDGPDGLARTLDLPHIPFTLVLDRDGAVVFTTTGSDARALEAIAGTARRLLAAGPVAAPTLAGEQP